MVAESDQRMAVIAVQECGVAQDQVDACLQELQDRPALTLAALLIEKRLLQADIVARLKLQVSPPQDTPISFAPSLPDTPRAPLDPQARRKKRASTRRLAFDEDVAANISNEICCLIG